MNPLQTHARWNDKTAQLRKLAKAEDAAFEIAMRAKRRDDERAARLRREEMEEREG